MSYLTSTELDAIVGVVVACAVLAFAGVWMIQRLRRRRDQLRGELSGPREVVSDRAFNRIAMARREIDLLSTQGVETDRARELIGQAQASFDARQFDRAYELSQTAHETLVAARKNPGTPAGRPLSSSAVVPPAPAHDGISAGPPIPDATAEGPTESRPRKIPLHRAESQFQIRLLEQEIAAAKQNSPSDGRIRLGEALLRQAQTASERSEFTEAFRLALRGRREIGSTVESMPPPSKGGRAPPAAAGTPTDDVEATAEEAAGGARCPRCGHPMVASDAYCRGCGAAREGAVCPECGTPRSSSDTFCGRCGKPFS